MADYRTTIKQWLKTSFKPTQTQFYNWLDMSWLKDEKIPVANIEGIDTLLTAKVDKEYVDNLFAALAPKITINGFEFEFKSISGNSSPVKPAIGDLALNGLLSDSLLATALRYLGGDISNIDNWELVGVEINIGEEEID